MYTLQPPLKGLVGTPGFEPGTTAPKTVVLPLHHAPISTNIKLIDTSVSKYGLRLLTVF